MSRRNLFEGAICLYRKLRDESVVFEETKKGRLLVGRRRLRCNLVRIRDLEGVEQGLESVVKIAAMNHQFPRVLRAKEEDPQIAHQIEARGDQRREGIAASVYENRERRFANEETVGF